MKTKLQTWHEMAVLLKETKEREAELRRELCEEFIGGAAMENGRVTVKGDDAGSGLSYIAVQSLSYNVDVAALEAIWSGLTDEEKGAIAYKPSVSLAKYRKIDDNSILQDAIISRLAMPTLKVV